MKKMLTLFKRDFTKKPLAYDEITEGCEWVASGEGRATRKWDGTCCLIEDGKLFKRYEVKKGNAPPPQFLPASAVSEETGKQQGWVPVGDGPDDQWHREAFGDVIPDGTYELVGPKVQSNPERFDGHVLIPHLGQGALGCPRDYAGIIKYLCEKDIEGIVWHHPDGRMVKIKKSDFGLKRTPVFS